MSWSEIASELHAAVCGLAVMEGVLLNASEKISYPHAISEQEQKEIRIAVMSVRERLRYILSRFEDISLDDTLRQSVKK